MGDFKNLGLGLQLTRFGFGNYHKNMPEKIPNQEIPETTAVCRVGNQSFSWKLKSDSNILTVLETLKSKDFEDLVAVTVLRKDQITTAITTINSKLKKELDLEDAILPITGNANRTTKHKLANSLFLSFELPNKSAIKK